VPRAACPLVFSSPRTTHWQQSAERVNDWSLVPEGRQILAQDVSPGKRCVVDVEPRRGERILEVRCTAPDGALSWETDRFPGLTSWATFDRPFRGYAFSVRCGLDAKHMQAASGARFLKCPLRVRIGWFPFHLLGK
jgi:hypothetical protein